MSCTIRYLVEQTETRQARFEIWALSLEALGGPAFFSLPAFFPWPITSQHFWLRIVSRMKLFQGLFHGWNELKVCRK